MKKIICAHLYNDFSGSPLVLSTIIKSFKSNKIPVEIITSTEAPGFLSDLNIKTISNNYKFVNNRYLRLMLFLICQIRMFFQTLKYRREEVVIYVNTLLPFGVALAGKLMGKKVIYHFHETSLKPLLLKKILKWVAAQTANEIIYVSDFLKKQEGLPQISARVIYNCLSDEFIKIAKSNRPQTVNNNPFSVLMLCSLKTYKGVNEFVKLAKRLPQLSFDLVLNATAEEIDTFFKDNQLPKNLRLYPKQSNVHPFYKKSNLVLNLSHPDEWIETFGMTLIEAMQYGLPVIAPPVGGPTEIVISDFNGYLIDQRDETELSNRIVSLATDKVRYQKLSQNAIQYVERFSKQNVESRLLKLDSFK